MGRGLGVAVPAPAAAEPIGIEVKPGEGIPLDVNDDLAELDAADLDASQLQPVAELVLTPKQQALQDNLDRRMVDAAVVRALAAEGFAGPRYARFEMQLAEYGLAVLPGFIRSGKIWGHCSSLGYRVSPTEADQAALEVDDWQGARDLALMVVAVTVQKFRQVALVQGRWSPEGGAALTTYFMGLVKYTFPNELRRWRRERLAPLPLLDGKAVIDAPHDHHLADPLHRVVRDDTMRRCLAEFTPNQQKILELAAMGMEQEEIAALLGLTSARAVEGRIRRVRQDPGTRTKVVRHG